MQPLLEVTPLFDKKTVDTINTMLREVEESRWTLRNSLPYGRAVNGAGCHYEFLGHSQMPKSFKDYLKSIAPVNSFPLQEIAINRYKAGDYIGSHRDADLYITNLVIALQENGDGLLIEDTDTFIEDVAGQGVKITGVGPIHSVPPVKSLRHCLIYLYG